MADSSSDIFWVPRDRLLEVQKKIEAGDEASLTKEDVEFLHFPLDFLIKEKKEGAAEAGKKKKGEKEKKGDKKAVSPETEESSTTDEIEYTVPLSEVIMVPTDFSAVAGPDLEPLDVADAAEHIAKAGSIAKACGHFLQAREKFLQLRKEAEDRLAAEEKAEGGPEALKKKKAEQKAAAKAAAKLAVTEAKKLKAEKGEKGDSEEEEDSDDSEEGSEDDSEDEILSRPLEITLEEWKQIMHQDIDMENLENMSEKDVRELLRLRAEEDSEEEEDDDEGDDHSEEAEDDEQAGGGEEEQSEEQSGPAKKKKKVVA